MLYEVIARMLLVVAAEKVCAWNVMGEYGICSAWVCGSLPFSSKHTE